MELCTCDFTMSKFDLAEIKAIIEESVVFDEESEVEEESGEEE